jgi:predicted nucleotidyltransferase
MNQNTSNTCLFKIPYGSIVYGTYNENSDIDILEIVENGEFSNPDMHLYTRDEYQRALDDHEIVPIETYFFAQKQFAHFPFEFKLDKWKLRKVFSATASNSWVKCKKKFIDGEFYIGKKSLFHSLRILSFAIQIADNNTLYFNLPSLCMLYKNIIHSENNWESLCDSYKLCYNELSSQLRKACPKCGTNGN